MYIFVASKCSMHGIHIQMIQNKLFPKITPCKLTVLLFPIDPIDPPPKNPPNFPVQICSKKCGARSFLESPAHFISILLFIKFSFRLLKEKKTNKKEKNTHTPVFPCSQYTILEKSKGFKKTHKIIFVVCTLSTLFFLSFFYICICFFSNLMTDASKFPYAMDGPRIFTSLC